MGTWPETIELKGERCVAERTLKDDFFSVNVLYRSPSGARWVLKLSDFRFVMGRLLRPLAAFESWREYRLYGMVADIPGVPELGPRLGARGYFHRYVEGWTLHEIAKSGDAARLPPDFFTRLRATVDEVHRRRIFYADLHKLGNVICGTDGSPWLIDFQIAKRFGAGPLARRLFELLKAEDVYHVYKHKKRFQPDLLTPEEARLAERTPLNEWYRKWVGKPYLRVKRLIYPSGSNETIWFKWRKEKDKSARMP